MRSRKLLLLSALTLWSGAALAAEPIGQVKTLSGSAEAIQAGSARPLAPGDRVFQGTTLRTGSDGAVGVTFADNSLVSLGPSSEMVVDRFTFDTTTHKGRFDLSLRKGTLAGKSGQIVAETPEAMSVRTPSMVLVVKGTKFLVRAGE